MKRIAAVRPREPAAGLARCARRAARRAVRGGAGERPRRRTARHPDHRGLESALLRRPADARAGSTEVEEAATARLAANAGDGMAHARPRAGRSSSAGGARRPSQAYEAAIATYSRAGIAAGGHPVDRAGGHPGDVALPGARPTTSCARPGKLMSTYLDKHPEDQDVLLMIADLYQSQRSPKGQSLAGEVLPPDPEGELRGGRGPRRSRPQAARLLPAGPGDPGARARARRPTRASPSALALLAAIHVGNGYYEKADGLLERALAVNPVAPRSAGRARRPGCGSRASARRSRTLEAEVMALNPDRRSLLRRPSRTWWASGSGGTTSQPSSRAKAIEIDPNDPLGYVTLR